MRIPFRWIQEAKPGSFLQMIYAWCRRVTPFHGYAGLAALQSPDTAQTRRTESSVYPFAMRFPGLEIEDTVTLSRYLHKGIKGVNWLTILSNELLEKVKGRDDLQNRLGEDFLFHDFPGGTIIQAGPKPEIGDVNRNLIPQYYKKLGGLLKPIRAKYPERYLQAPEGVDSLEMSKKWFARFD